MLGVALQGLVGGVEAAAPHRRTTVPRHKEIAKGTLRAIRRDTGFTPERLRDLL